MNNLKVCFALGFFILLSSGASQADTLTLKDWNLTCLIIDGEGSNDVLTILRVDKSGNANGTICYVDLGTTTLLEKCHPVRGTVTGVQQIKIAFQGVDFLPDSNTATPRRENTEDHLTTFSGAFTYVPNGSARRAAVVATDSSSSSQDPRFDTASIVQGPATAVRCKAFQAPSKQEPSYTLVVNTPRTPFNATIPVRTAYQISSDNAAPFIRWNSLTFSCCDDRSVPM